MGTPKMKIIIKKITKNPEIPEKITVITVNDWRTFIVRYTPTTKINRIEIILNKDN